MPRLEKKLAFFVPLLFVVGCNGKVDADTNISPVTLPDVTPAATATATVTATFSPTKTPSPTPTATKTEPPHPIATKTAAAPAAKLATARPSETSALTATPDNIIRKDTKLKKLEANRPYDYKINVQANGRVEITISPVGHFDLTVKSNATTINDKNFLTIFGPNKLDKFGHPIEGESPTGRGEVKQKDPSASTYNGGNASGDHLVVITNHSGVALDGQLSITLYSACEKRFVPSSYSKNWQYCQ